MKKQTRRKFTPEFKAKVALEAIKDQMTLAQLAQKFEVNAVIISKWKSEFLANMSSVKYEYIYLNPCDTGLELFGGVQAHIEYYHNKTHQTLKTSPNEAFEKSIKKHAA